MTNKATKYTSILKMTQDSETEQVQMGLAFDPSPSDLPEGEELPASYQLMIDVASGLHAAILGAQEIQAEEDERAVQLELDFTNEARTIN